MLAQQTAPRAQTEATLAACSTHARILEGARPSVPPIMQMAISLIAPSNLGIGKHACGCAELSSRGGNGRSCWLLSDRMPLGCLCACLMHKINTSWLMRQQLEALHDNTSHTYKQVVVSSCINIATADCVAETKFVSGPWCLCADTANA